MSEQPGLVVLFSSGETSASGRRVYDWLLRRLSSPVHMAVLETPAGFQPNSAHVAAEVADFLRDRLQNYHPNVTVVPARRRGTSFSPDDPQIVAPLLTVDVIFLGPGSPTYAVRQLQGSLAWQTLVARQRLGAAIVLASAATIAAGVLALPVYEIYKVGEELHWAAGLDLLGAYGLKLVFISHWNNQEGGETLDTSRCFMGQARFDQLWLQLPADSTVVGIDEHTALVIDVAAATCRVMGRGGVTLLRSGVTRRYSTGQTFTLAELGDFQLPPPQTDIPDAVWQAVQAAQASQAAASAPTPPPQVLELVQQREAARARREWATADHLRQQLAGLGWQVVDTPAGPTLKPK